MKFITLAIAALFISTAQAQTITCDDRGCSDTEVVSKTVKKTARTRRVTFIPNPPGTWRVKQSCAHRLAAYWGLGKGLDKVSVWTKRFARAHSPGPRIAAIRRDLHHIIGVKGGGPGAWHVVDFNSGGHRNRAYTIPSLDRYILVDTTSPRYANR